MTARDDEAQAPLYQRVMRELKDAIARGEYDPDRPFTTQREICERFRVSSTTAVRALNELVAAGYLIRRRGAGTFVAPDRERARPHRPGGSIACIMTSQGPHNSAVAAGVSSVCGELGLRMYFVETAGSPAREEAALRQALESGVDGIVLYPVQGSYDPAVFGELRRHRVPVVMVDRYRPDVASDVVVSDNFAVGRDVTTYLVDHGHRRIATLWSETECTSVRDRMAGHMHALREHDIPVHPAFTQLTQYEELLDGRRRAMLKDLLGMSDPPTAFLCSQGHVLATALHDLAALGVDVPGRVELAGMDHLGPFNLLPFALVTAVIPSEPMGTEAMRLLAQRLTEDEPYANLRHLVLPTSVQTRDSAPGYLQVVSRSAAFDATGTP